MQGLDVLVGLDYSKWNMFSVLLLSKRDFGSCAVPFPDNNTVIGNKIIPSWELAKWTPERRSHIEAEQDWKITDGNTDDVQKSAIFVK